MIQGTFDVAVDTPKLHRRGTCALKSDGEAILGRLSAGELEGIEFAGTCSERVFTFEGSGEFGALGRIGYHAEGEVWGNTLEIKCETSAGTVTIFGTRLSQAAGDFRSSHEYLMAASRADFSNDDSTMYSGLYADGG